MESRGADGPDTFDDDVTADYVELLENGLSPADATYRLLSVYADLLADQDEANAFWIALAVTQIEHGHLQPKVRSGALAALKTIDLHRWFDARPDIAARRQNVLERFQQQLEAD